MSKNILFILTGSIAAYKSCYVISKLVQNGYTVQAAASRNALRFVGTATLEGLTGRAVFTDAYEAGRMMDHINLSKWADLSILCPATANAINKLAHGIADDVIGTLFLSFDLRKPYLIAPAMNQQMFAHPSTQDSLARLARLGVRVLPTETGYQACGDVGPGRLMEPDKIFDAIITSLDVNTRPLQVTT